MGDISDSTNLVAGPAGEGSERLFGGRYRTTRLLKKGQGVETLLGTDLVQGDAVVIKTFSDATFSPVALVRLEHEGEVLRKLRTPEVAPVVDLGREDHGVYLVQSFIPGVTLQTRLSRAPLAVRETLTLACRLMAALKTAHAHGVLHRDIKPANLVVDEDSPLQRATLRNFGMAREGRLDAEGREQLLGTALYLSPEQAGLLNREVDERSDLYAAGNVFFECLAGRPPFQGNTVGEVLRQHLTAPPPDLRSLGRNVPRALEELIQRLLRKDPRERYQSAEAVLADLQAIAELLDRGVAEPAVVLGAHDRRLTLVEPSFVGREDELAALAAQLERARQGMGGLVLVEAESGGGKTRLLDELAQRAACRGVSVLRGQGLDQVAQRPFQVLTGLARDLLAARRLSPELPGTIGQRLGEQRQAVIAALPELADTLGSGPSDLLGPETFGETRSLQAFASLLDALGTAARPALVLLDDCQWADDLTVKLLRYQQRGQEPRKALGRHLLVVVAFRSEEVPAGHGLRGLQPSAHLRLRPFSAADVQRLAESMAGRLPAEILETVERLSEGSPFMASAVLRGLVESGALQAEAAGWRVEAAALADVRSSLHAAAFLARRLALLPPDTMRVLSAGAILGREFELELAALLAEQTPQLAAAVLREARRRSIVWARAGEARYVFFHDKLRETVLARLAEEERRQLHRRAALHLESLDRTRLFELAYHFDAAGEYSRALPYALTAAESARQRHALAIAEEQYRIAERGAAQADRSTRYRIAEGLGDVLMLRGRYDEATLNTVTAGELAEGDVARAQIEGKLGELAFKRGDLKTATEALERALDLLGHKVPRWSGMFFVRILWEAIVQVLHSMLPGLFVARRPLEGVDKELLIMRLYIRLSYAYWFGRGPVPCLWAHLRGLNLAERYPPTLELAHTYSTHAPIMSLLAYYSRGIVYAQKALAICQSLGDLWGQGQALHFNGLVLFAASRFEECIEKCREAVRLMERTGDLWEVNIARYHIANSLLRLGDLPAAVAEARRIHQSGLELGDIQATGICIHVWVQASGGKVSPETLQIEIQRQREDVQVSAQVMLAEGVRLFTLDRVEEAAGVFEKAYQVAAKAGVVNPWVLPLHSWLASALRRQAEKISPWTPKHRTALLKQARQAAKKALKVARTFQNDLPHALREAGLVAAMRGKPRQARRYLDESLDVAQRQGAKFENAQTHLARGRVGLALAWPGAAEELAAARQALLELGADFALDEPAPHPVAPEPVTLSLADRFDTVLEDGRRIASALSREAIFTAVRDAALKLLRGEQCLVLEVNPDGGAETTPVTGEFKGEYSRTMVRHTLADRRVLTFAEGVSADASESLLLSEVRSALCAPILVRGRPEACFYVTHRQVSGLFGEDEQRLAEFIATIAGAALENTAGFAQLRALNETLEERVAERSAVVEARSKELARSNADLEQFAYVASHDLQEPLRAVSGYCALLQRGYQGKLDEKAKNYIMSAVEGAERMATLIQDLLEFARVTRRGEPFQPTDFNEVLAQALARLKAALEESAAKVEYTQMPTFPADKGQQIRLFQNLIGNAVKFRSQRPPEVRITAEQTADEWLFSVRDNGIGIEPKYRDRIFVIFQRLHTREDYPGTGIGLAVCKRIVERHGGRIWVESTPGEGSTFFFTLAKHQGERT